MTVQPGARLGPYVIVSPLGAGGMGEVYRARDTKLDRDVAIKVLPSLFAGDPVALARFEREAKAVAALSHPNILAIHDFGTAGSTAYAVMELLDGRTLRERLAESALPPRKAIEIAIQIAHGLAAAHEKGIVHRDLKPDNVFVSPNGRVKILDFGLAKAVPVAATVGETVAAAGEATTPGMVVGTFGYMSPEQITGAPVDHRTDIFAFGAIVYEMLTGARAFRRESTAETIAAILKEDPPELPLASGVPPQLERIVRRCLEKNPAERFHSAHDIGIALEAVNDRSASSPATAPSRTGTRRMWPALAAAGTIGALAVASAGAVIWRARDSRPASAVVPVRKFHVPARRLVVNRSTRPVLSPDGAKVAFVAGDSLWIQELNQLDARQLATSWRPTQLFWSSDSGAVAFISENKLWKVPVNGGQPVALADAPALGGGAGGCWRPDGKIVFTRSVKSSGLLEMSQYGGQMTSLASLQEGDLDFHEPSFVQGTNAHLVVVHRLEGADNITIFQGEARKEILRLPGESVFFPQYSPTGHIVFGRTGKSDGVWAIPFDATGLETTGEPFLIAAGGLWPSVANDGTLTFIRRIWSEPRQLVVVTRSGSVERTIGEPQPGLGLPVLAPDGRRVVVTAGPPGRRDLWVYDLDRGGRSRLTFLEKNVGATAWTPDNRILLFMPGPTQTETYAQAADGTGHLEKLFEGNSPSLSRGGDLVAFVKVDESKETDSDLYYRARSDTASKVFLERPGTQAGPRLTPDGRYIAYQSNESGRYEVYVKPFPGGAGQWQVSFGGGSDPRWSGKGDKLWFRGFGNALMEVAVHAGAAFTLGEPRELFKADPIAVDLTVGYQPLANGDAFMAVRTVPDPDGSAPSITVVQNWFGEFANRGK